MNEIVLTENNGDLHVFLDTVGDDHIAIKCSIDTRGYEKDITLPYGSFAWERAVMRAMRGIVFL